jgi:hypothetical protein
MYSACSLFPCRCSFVDLRTRTGFSALHYATFWGFLGEWWFVAIGGHECIHACSVGSCPARTVKMTRQQLLGSAAVAGG